jgi:hypothetical protein
MYNEFWWGKPEGKRKLGRARRMWLYKIKMHPWGIDWNSMDWFDLVQDRDQCRALVNTVMNLWIVEHIGKCLSS